MQDRDEVRTVMKTQAIFMVAALSLASGWASAQTTRTSPSASSTYKSIPSSSSTSANSPCNANNPTSPCFSANAPRNPCYSAVNPDEPCSTTTAPPSTTASPQALPATPAPASQKNQTLTGSAITVDQAKSQIEAAGYSNVSGLRRDSKGIWEGKAVKDGATVVVTLGANGNVTAK